jgi:hypothetical protein
MLDSQDEQGEQLEAVADMPLRVLQLRGPICQEGSEGSVSDNQHPNVDEPARDGLAEMVQVHDDSAIGPPRNLNLHADAHPSPVDGVAFRPVDAPRLDPAPVSGLLKGSVKHDAYLGRPIRSGPRLFLKDAQFEAGDDPTQFGIEGAESETLNLLQGATEHELVGDLGHGALRTSGSRTMDRD